MLELVPGIYLGQQKQANSLSIQFCNLIGNGNNVTKPWGHSMDTWLGLGLGGQQLALNLRQP